MEGTRARGAGRFCRESRLQGSRATPHSSPGHVSRSRHHPTAITASADPTAAMECVYVSFDDCLNRRVDRWCAHRHCHAARIGCFARAPGQGEIAIARVASENVIAREFVAGRQDTGSRKAEGNAGSWSFAGWEMEEPRHLKQKSGQGGEALPAVPLGFALLRGCRLCLVFELDIGLTPDRLGIDPVAAGEGEQTRRA
jgi:hypothetical protein